MEWIKLTKKSFIDSQIFVSLMGTFLAVFFLFHEQKFQWDSSIIIFITYFCGYIYTKFQNSKYFRKVLILNILLGFISLFLITRLKSNSFLVKWLTIIILGFLYNSKFLFRYIRKIPLVKIFYVGLVWALVNSWLCFSELKMDYFIINFLFISALVLPFDIRDVNEDDIITFPKIIGTQKTKYFGYFLIFFACLLSIFKLNPIFATAFFLTTIISFILIYFSEPNRNDCYFSFIVELCSGLPFILIFILMSNYLR